jgi:hypothetical protein
MHRWERGLAFIKLRLLLDIKASRPPSLCFIAPCDCNLQVLIHDKAPIESRRGWRKNPSIRRVRVIMWSRRKSRAPHLHPPPTFFFRLSTEKSAVEPSDILKESDLEQSGEVEPAATTCCPLTAKV